MSSMDEIRQIFEEEALEGLDTMESGLLNLEAGEADADIINDIFRAAHSIKGGSATFGFSRIAGFTHIMETLLDLVRDGEKQITADLVQLFLQCVDCLRDMMAAIHTDEYDDERIAELTAQLEAALPGGAGDETPPEAAPAATAAAVAAGPTRGWTVEFKPHANLLTTGNSPLHILRALGDLGDIELKAHSEQIPDFGELDPEELHIAWTIELSSDCDEAQVREVFEWVEDQCELQISPRGQELKAAPPAPERRGGGDRRQQDRRDPVQKKDRRSGDRRKKGATRESGSIRVGIDKIDNLLNLVGELVITQAMLGQYARDDDGDNRRDAGFSDTLEQLTRNTRELQEACMQIRMLPVSVTFSRFPRLVHDLSSKLGKKIKLEISGEQTELDKTVLEKIGDPLVHLIRNSLDHGIEPGQERIAAGKPEEGTVHVSASHEAGNIVIRVQDDGGGLNGDKILAKAIDRGLVAEGEELTDQQIHNLIFMPGFSTADVVSDVSGRGVGMDVVRSNIEEIGGRVEVHSQRGVGSTFSITLPLTLAIMDGQLVRVQGETYIIPLLAIIETVQIEPQRLNVIAGESTVYRLRGNAIPVISMGEVLRVEARAGRGQGIDERLLVIVESGREVVGVAVDELMEQQQVVIKSLESNFVQVDGLLGATILGDGKVALIVDIAGLLRLSRGRDERAPTLVASNA